MVFGRNGRKTELTSKRREAPVSMLPAAISPAGGWPAGKGGAKPNLRLGREAEEDALFGAIHRNGGGADVAARIIKPGRAQGIGLGLELE